MTEPEPEPEKAEPAEPAEPGTGVPADEPTGDPVFELLWQKVLESWDDDKVHAALLEYAITAERLPDAAGRYRARKDDPAKGERAQKRLDAIVLAATHLMMSMKTPASVKVPLPITLSAFGIFAAVLLFVAYAMLHRP